MCYIFKHQKSPVFWRIQGLWIPTQWKTFMVSCTILWRKNSRSFSLFKRSRGDQSKRLHNVTLSLQETAFFSIKGWRCHQHYLAANTTNSHRFKSHLKYSCFHYLHVHYMSALSLSLFFSFSFLLSCPHTCKLGLNLASSMPKNLKVLTSTANA